MASTIAATLRLTFKNNATLRQCAGCGALIPLTGTETRCSTCRTPAAALRRRAA